MINLIFHFTITLKQKQFNLVKLKFTAAHLVLQKIPLAYIHAYLQVVCNTFFCYLTKYLEIGMHFGCFTCEM